MSYSLRRTVVVSLIAVLIPAAAANAATKSIAPGSGGASLGAATSAKSSGASGGSSTSAPKKSRPRHTTNSGHLGDRTLRQGMRGHDVRVLQDYLTRAGFLTGVDGDFGPGTAASVRAFERSQRIKADGVVTAKVAGVLRAAVARAAKTNSGPVGAGRLNGDGTASPPGNVPDTIKRLFAAANRIATKPYIYGGGHASWNDSGYDCSGSLSYALHGAGLLSAPLDSTEFETYGSSGPGRWISIWSNSGHTYMYVAGLRFDTSAQSSTGGSRWTNQVRSNRGFVESHPTGW